MNLSSWLFHARKVAQLNGKTLSWPISGSIIFAETVSLKEAGLTLKIRPKVPGAKPFHESLKSRLKFPEWEFFVKKVSARRFPAQIRLTLDSEIPKRSAIVKSAAPFPV